MVGFHESAWVSDISIVSAMTDDDDFAQGLMLEIAEIEEASKGKFMKKVIQAMAEDHVITIRNLANALLAACDAAEAALKTEANT